MSSSKPEPRILANMPIERYIVKKESVLSKSYQTLLNKQISSSSSIVKSNSANLIDLENNSKTNLDSPSASKIIINSDNSSSLLLATTTTTTTTQASRSNFSASNATRSNIDENNFSKRCHDISRGERLKVDENDQIILNDDTNIKKRLDKSYHTSIRNLSESKIHQKQSARKNEFKYFDAMNPSDEGNNDTEDYDNDSLKALQFV